MNIEIFTAADAPYIDVLKVMLLSFVRHAQVPGDVPVSVLTPGGDLARFVDDPWFRQIPVALRFVAVDGLPDGVPVGHAGRVAYARLSIPKIAAGPTQTALYLDADTMIRGSLRPLFEEDWFQGKPMAAVQEADIATVSTQSGVFDWREMDLAADWPYFNSGVLLLRLDEIRAGRLFDRVTEYLIARGRRVNLWDQGGLNAIFANQWSKMPIIYNWTTARNRRRTRRGCLPAHGLDPADAVIAHFSGSGFCKPWHVNSLSPFRLEYRAYLEEIGSTLEQSGKWERLLGRRLARGGRRLKSVVAGVDTRALASKTLP